MFTTKWGNNKTKLSFPVYNIYFFDIRTPANISTSDQRFSDIENETESDVGFSMLYNVDTTSVPDIETTLIQLYLDVVSTCSQL